MLTIAMDALNNFNSLHEKDKASGCQLPQIMYIKTAHLLRTSQRVKTLRLAVQKRCG
jgi:hypothetical protein